MRTPPTLCKHPVVFVRFRHVTVGRAPNGQTDKRTDGFVSYVCDNVRSVHNTHTRPNRVVSVIITPFGFCVFVFVAFLLLCSRARVVCVCSGRQQQPSSQPQSSAVVVCSVVNNPAVMTHQLFNVHTAQPDTAVNK